MGLMYDIEDNVIAFISSMNEITTDFFYNMETVDVYKSWEENSV
jgi:hypothetical protein